MARKKKTAAKVVKIPEPPFEYRNANQGTSKLTLEMLREIAKTDAQDKLDIRIKAKSVRFVPSTAKEQEGGHGNMIEFQGQGFEFNRHSWGQFASTLGFPAGYALKVDPDQRAGMVRYHQKAEPDTEMVFRLRNRDANGKPAEHAVRAVVPPSFSRFDNAPFLEHLMHVAKPEHLIRACTMNDNSLYLVLGEKSLYDSLGTESVSRLNRVGKVNDPLASGMAMRNSETDLHPFQVDQIIWRLICTNGMMGWVPKAYFKRSKVWGDILAFRDVCSDALREVSQLTTPQIVKLRASRARVYEKGRAGHERVLKSLFKTFSLTAGGNMDEVLLRWDRFPSGNPVDPDQGDTYTKFGLVDALTRCAQQLGNREEQHKWEVAAGRFLAAA
jgi:hypothetical protein